MKSQSLQELSSIPAQSGAPGSPASSPPSPAPPLGSDTVLQSSPSTGTSSVHASDDGQGEAQHAAVPASSKEHPPLSQISTTAAEAPHDAACKQSSPQASGQPDGRASAVCNPLAASEQAMADCLGQLDEQPEPGASLEPHAEGQQAADSHVPPEPVPAVEPAPQSAIAPQRRGSITEPSADKVQAGGSPVVADGSTAAVLQHAQSPVQEAGTGSGQQTRTDLKPLKAGVPPGTHPLSAAGGLSAKASPFLARVSKAGPTTWSVHLCHDVAAVVVDSMPSSSPLLYRHLLGWCTCGPFTWPAHACTSPCSWTACTVMQDLWRMAACLHVRL